MAMIFKVGDEVFPLAPYIPLSQWTFGKSYRVSAMSNGSPVVHDDNGRMCDVDPKRFVYAPAPTPVIESVEAKLRAWIVANYVPVDIEDCDSHAEGYVDAIEMIVRDVLGEKLRIETRREVVLVPVDKGKAE